MTGAVLTRLRLAGFRSYQAAVIEPQAPLVILTGPNGAGKTNILEAISLLSPGRGLRRAEPGELPRRGGDGSWRVAAMTGSPGDLRELTTGAAEGEPRSVGIDGKQASQLALAEVLRVVWLTPAMDRLWLEGPGDRRRFLDRLVMSLDPAHGPASLGYEKAMRERNRLLKDQVRDPAWFEALEAQMGDHGAAIAAGRDRALAALAGAQDQGASAFPAASLSILRGEDAAWHDAASLRAALARGRGADYAAGRSLTGPHRHDLGAIYAAKATPAHLCSTGEQKALLISLILALARVLARDNGSPPVLLFDEVAAHLDAGRRAALYDEIRLLGAQAWLTGTGRELFEAAGPESDVLEVAETAAGSVLGRG